MAYRRKSYNRRYRGGYRRGRRPYKPKQTSLQEVATTAATAWKWGKIAMSLLNSEIKFFDTQETTAIQTTWSTPQSLVLVPQGDTDNHRDGSKIRVKSLNVKAYFNALSTLSDATQLRLVVFRAKVKPSQVTATDVYPAQVTGFRNEDHTDQYNVLLDKQITLDLDTRSSIMIDKFWKLDVPITFDGNTATPELDSFYWMYRCTTPGVGNVSTELRSRIRYIDN